MCHRDGRVGLLVSEYLPVKFLFNCVKRLKQSSSTSGTLKK